MRGPLRSLQIRVFALTWLSYATYYLTRKNLSVVKSRLHEEVGVPVAALSQMDTLYLLGYALGQFASGLLTDRLGPRRLIAYGMLGSAVASLLFAQGASIALFVLAFGVNGLFQSTGWASNVKAMQPWFPAQVRGTVMGLWSTNYQAGGLIATALATYLLVHFGWRHAFWIPGVLVAAMGLGVFFLLVEHPADRGLSVPGAPAEARGGADGAAGADRAALRALLQQPTLWMLGGAYFGLKLIRYSLLFWLPFYLKRQLHYSEGTAGYLSIAFEAGGIVGAVLIGGCADRYFPQRRIRLAAPVVLGLAAALLLYQTVAPWGLWPNAAAMALCGFMLFGPDTLISGAAAQDLGGSRQTGTAAGIINGMGSIGAIFQGVVTSRVSTQYGWEALFQVFMVLALCSGVLLLPLALRRAPRAPL